MSYEQLDAIADAYIPLLAIVLLIMLSRDLLRKHFKAARQLGIATLLALMYVYGLMMIDMHLHIWPSLSLDYSTHTALSLALVQLLIVTAGAFIIQAGLVVSIIAYAILMVYQQYHTVLDIVSTALVIGSAVHVTNKFVWNTKVSEYQRS